MQEETTMTKVNIRTHIYGGGAVCTEMRYYDISLETCEENCNTKLGCKGISHDKEAKRCLLKDVATCGETTPPGVGGFGFVDGGGSVFYGRSVSSRHSPRDKLCDSPYGRTCSNGVKVGWIMRTCDLPESYQASSLPF